MQFMSIIRGPEVDTIPAGLFEAMGPFMEEATQAGVLVSTGGLAPSKDGVRIRINNRKLSRTDGPFSETKEVVGGYAILECETKEEAIGWTERFLQLHIDHFPGWEGECELRAMMTEDQLKIE